MNGEGGGRTRLLLGDGAVDRLARARVAVFGLGGVGGAAAEALVRTGVGALDIIDPDRIEPSNLNRQLLATGTTEGMYKTDAAAARYREIAPDVKITAHRVFFAPGVSEEFDFARYDYILDAVDTVAAKTELAVRAERAGVPLISCMGTGRRIDPSALAVGDIYETSGCPLARVMRRELRRRGITRLKTVYSKEPPGKATGPGGRTVPSCIFVPAAAGMLMAAEVVKDLCGL